MACDFIVQLSKLRKSSAESVENTNEFDRFKKYLHVERQVEIELRNILKEVNKKQNKCLMLLCGSAGDGKSHIISYMKNHDSEKLLTDYEVYNDATESSDPKSTSIDTLAQKLSDFNDEHYDIQDGKKMIIAINLGTLNNFIDSEKGKSFSKLRKYVEENQILSSYTEGSGYRENSVFQHISFADYQVFSLCETGIETKFLEKLLAKIFNKTDDNPFYLAYKNASTCSVHHRCPVRHNYEFLSNLNHQKEIIERIVKAVIIDKTIVSTREVLNLLYDLIVHPEYDKNGISVGTSEIQFLSNYISWTTPMLLNEYDDISSLLNSIKKHDVLKIRDERMDENTIRFHSMENIENIFKFATEDTSYKVLNTISNISELGGKKPEFKKLVYKFVVRLQEIKMPKINNKQQHRFNEYLQYLYFQNSGNEAKLGPLYEATKKAVLNWGGEFDKDVICIDDSNEQLWILEQLYLRAAINRDVSKVEGEIQRFFPVISLKYRKEEQSYKDATKIRIDFKLFELIANMREGYKPTVKDKNRHTDFVSFVHQLKELGNKSTRIIIVPKDSNKNYRMIFEESDFGYEFKVVE